MRRSIVVSFTLLPACFAAPNLEVPSFDDASTGISLDDGDEEPYVPEGTSGDSAGDETTFGPSETDTTPGDVTTSEVESTEGSESDESSESGGSDVFPAPEPFGDDVRELDLVGSWTMPWDPNDVADVSITIASDGAFTWRETEADCSDGGSASGRLWVEGSQLVMHVDAWDKKDPWDVEAVLGEPLEVPFRMRIGYAPMGGYLGFAARKRFTDVVQWRGAGYVRLDAGTGPQSAWANEAELWAVPAGATEPQLLVRDRFSATLVSGGIAIVDHAWTWWWPEQGIQEVDSSDDPWVDETPGNVAGAASIGDDTFAYDAVHMMAFEADRSFKLGVVSDCS
jgi:hypothetical protein